MIHVNHHCLYSVYIYPLMYTNNYNYRYILMFTRFLFSFVCIAYILEIFYFFYKIGNTPIVYNIHCTLYIYIRAIVLFFEEWVLLSRKILNETLFVLLSEVRIRFFMIWRKISNNFYFCLFIFVFKAIYEYCGRKILRLTFFCSCPVF